MTKSKQEWREHIFNMYWEESDSPEEICDYVFTLIQKSREEEREIASKDKFAMLRASLKIKNEAVLEERQRVVEMISKLKPRGFGFDKSSMDMGYEMCKKDLQSKLSKKIETLHSKDDNYVTSAQRIMDFCVFCNASNVFEDGRCIVCHMTRREFPIKKASDVDKIKRLGNREGVKLSSTIGGQRELIRQHRNKINEIIDYLNFPSDKETI